MTETTYPEAPEGWALERVGDPGGLYYVRTHTSPVGRVARCDVDAETITLTHEDRTKRKLADALAEIWSRFVEEVDQLPEIVPEPVKPAARSGDR